MWAFRLLVAALLGANAAGLATHKPAKPSCMSRQEEVAALIQAKIFALGVKCEEMCKKMGIYPDCTCPGYNGQAADDDAGVTRSCYDSWCKDPKAPCMGGHDSGDSFVTCVKTRTAGGPKLLQWENVLGNLDTVTKGLLHVNVTGAPPVQQAPPIAQEPPKGQGKPAAAAPVKR